jgi:two-component system, chemotaxis family, protein-glutamate methylesterase/glutaminase
MARAGSTETARPQPLTVERDTVVVGASAGGVEALANLVSGLPGDIPVSLYVVLHMPTGAASRLPEILTRVGTLPATPAINGAEPENGYIYVAPPDHHLILSAGRMFLVDGARENGVRPAVDPLFRSAARTLGPRVIGVILSGTMDDGAAGMAAIAAAGGTTIVQDPADALADGMPRSAMEATDVDHVIRAGAMGRLIDELAREPVEAPYSIAASDRSLLAEPLELPAYGVDLACPECGGALQEIRPGSLARFRCRVGHTYSSEALLAGKGSELEGALWAALRALEETATVSGRLASTARERGATGAAQKFDERRRDAAERADLIRGAIQSLSTTVNETTEEALAEG